MFRLFKCLEGEQMRTWISALALVAVASGAAPVAAGPMMFDLVGVDDPNLMAHVVFGYDPAEGRIDVDITNTSGPGAGPDPRFTAFAFNVPDEVTGVSNFTGPTGWDDSFDLNDINTPGQFGFFDLAGITGPNFNGGSPNDGIAVGDTPFHFEFFLLGTGLAGLNETSFLSLLSFDPPGNPNESEQYFIGRFQRTGLEGEGSDVAIPSGPPTPFGSPVPEPASLLLLGSGLTGLWLARRRRS